MSGDPPADRHVEALVRAYLGRQERAVDPRRILDGVREREAAGADAARPGLPGRTPRRWLRLGIGLAAAALILLTAAPWGLLPGPARVKAGVLLREARTAHASSIDRCYRVRIEPFPDARWRYPALAAGHATRVWTRGDRFYVTSPQAGGQRAWGLDDRRRLWMAPFPWVGFVFEPDEVPESMAVVCGVYTMRLETLLDELMTDFDVVIEPPQSDTPPGVVRIRAALKSGHAHPNLRDAALEVDARTKVITRAVLTRTHRGRPVAVVTLALDETRPRPDDSYQLAGHLTPHAPVFGPGQPRARRLLLLGVRSLLGRRGGLVKDPRLYRILFRLVGPRFPAPGGGVRGPGRFDAAP